MNRESWIAIGGLAVAATLFVGSRWYAEKTAATTKLLQIACEQWVINPYEQTGRPPQFETYQVQDAIDGKVISIVAMEEPTTDRLAAIFATPLTDGSLVMLPSCGYLMPEGVLLPVQKDLSAARARHDSVEEISEFLVMLIGALSIIPFTWFFLLDRLQELSNAVRGRPPR